MSVALISLTRIDDIPAHRNETIRSTRSEESLQSYGGSTEVSTVLSIIGDKNQVIIELDTKDRYTNKASTDLKIYEARNVE